MLVLVLVIFYTSPSIGDTEFLENILKNVHQNYNLSTVVIVKSDEPSIFTTSYPQIIMAPSSMTDFMENYSKRTLYLIYIEEIEVLDGMAFNLQKFLDSRILLISDKLQETSVFERCYNLNLPNVVLFSNWTFFSYCFTSPLKIFPVNQQDIFKSPWFLNFKNLGCECEIEIGSRNRQLGQFKEVFKAYSSLLNCAVKVVGPEEQSQKVNMVMVLDNLNSSHYETVSFLSYLYIVLIVPTKSEGASSDGLYTRPFDGYLWILLTVSCLYIGGILSVIGWELSIKKN